MHIQETFRGARARLVRGGRENAYQQTPELCAISETWREVRTFAPHLN
jgi:hypothetical protein